MLAKEWLDENYPPEKRKDVEKISVVGNGIEGELKLEGFDNIISVFIAHTYIQALDLRSCDKLKKLACIQNYRLNSTEFLSTLSNPKKLTHLNITNNNFYPQCLEFLSPFICLEELSINKNPMFGSLKYLKKMTKLKLLQIIETSIGHDSNNEIGDFGLEYLPESLNTILWESICDERKRDNEKFLKRELKNSGNNNYLKWRKEFQNQIEENPIR